MGCCIRSQCAIARIVRVGMDVTLHAHLQNAFDALVSFRIVLRFNFIPVQCIHI